MYAYSPFITLKEAANLVYTSLSTYNIALAIRLAKAYEGALP